MNKQNIVQSNDADTDTFKCSKCSAIWRAKGHYNYDEGGWVYDGIDDHLCPLGCVNFFGFRVKGKISNTRHK